MVDIIGLTEHTKKKNLHFPGTLWLGDMWLVVANEIGVEVVWITSRLRQWKACFVLFCFVPIPLFCWNRCVHLVLRWSLGWWITTWYGVTQNFNRSHEKEINCCVLSHWCFRINFYHSTTQLPSTNTVYL